jgi:hypothetical protein
MTILGADRCSWLPRLQSVGRRCNAVFRREETGSTAVANGGYAGNEVARDPMVSCFREFAPPGQLNRWVAPAPCAKGFN